MIGASRGRYHGYVTIKLLVLLILVVMAGLFAAMTAAVGAPLMKMVRSGKAVPVSQGLVLGISLIAALGIVIAIAVVVARL